MAPVVPVPRIIQLATTIKDAVLKIQETLDTLGALSPSFDENAPLLPVHIGKAQDIVLDATAELHDLLTEPTNMIHRLARVKITRSLHLDIFHQQTANFNIDAISHFGIAELIPPNGQASFKEISDRTPLTEQMVSRIIRHAAMMRIFCEPEPGIVKHTKASRILADPDARDWTRAGIEELSPAGAKGFSLAHNITGSIYDVLAENPDRAARFSSAMKMMTSRPAFDLSYGTDYYDWKSLGEAQVVDVGGARGHFAMALARQYSQLRIIVQDMAKVIENANAGEVSERVRFLAHNLFDPQPIRADVYFFRWIFHNWSDVYCIRILKAQLPALKPGARLVIQEVFMPEPGSLAYWNERDIRSMDLEMAFTFNSRERTLADWEALFKAADPGFVLKGVVNPPGSAMGILEFVWEGRNGSA
ncbi:O-methyltransferase, putative [Trichophyton benhamiae CBS 112371]|uniref:O-methyltransferase, putative n=1 Tax=Arthroderma benhamiae (strain ATCC MYA-4681 / CBS 112371) TaxID=663331 RepID=D4AQC4_ARTBC|nr:O-methyltransferase, putative [Trichophyton benhamiae CBS 112371]EFE34668.1 O-methyltransferase, putative [Trichophyton benhamiae CBS 112371]